MASYLNVKPLSVSYDSNGLKVVSDKSLPLCLCKWGESCANCSKPVKLSRTEYRSYSHGTLLKSILKRISK